MIAGAREAHPLHVCLLVYSNREGISIQTGSGLLLPSKKKKTKKARKGGRNLPGGRRDYPKRLNQLGSYRGGGRRDCQKLMVNNKLLTIPLLCSRRNAGDGTFPLRCVPPTNSVNEMASYLTQICMVVTGLKDSLKVHPLCARKRIKCIPTKRL